MALAPPAPQAIVVFGASGDLAHRKILPALYCLASEGLLPERHTIIGCATRDWDDEAFREEARKAVVAHDHVSIDDPAWKSFADSLSWLQGSFEDPDTYRRLAERLDAADRDQGCEGGRLYYLAVPPESFATIVQGIASVDGNTPTSRLVVEKPFGTSLESARELTKTIHESFDESQLFRIDHYLGKETVQNLVVIRFGNSLFERMLNRDVVDNVQLTVAEEIGTEGRAGYYDHSGAIRDLLQNHMLQVLAFLTMEPPRALDPEAFRDEQAKVLKTIRVLEPADIVRGQYEGYRGEDGVDPSSQTETYIATRLWIDNWRWEDVPFFLRHGKKLPERNTEITVGFRRAPDYLFHEMGIEDLPADHLTIRIQPNEGMSLAFQAKHPGPGYELQTVRMDFAYDRSFDHAPAEAYERLLHDAMDGDHTLFPREDAVDRAWEIVTPILEADTPLFQYAPGTWGPAEAEELIAPRSWHLRTRTRRP